MADEHDERIGQTLLGRLRVIRLLGEGGMGSVYEVEHVHTRHRRALKLLPAALREDEQVARFLRQASVGGAVKNRHIVETLDAGELDDGTPYVLMEMLAGETLGERLSRERTLSVSEICRLVREAAIGVHAAHEAGIVHRDLKPDNLFVVRDESPEREFVKVLDFGISKFAMTWDQAGTLTRDGAVMGTPYYMAPEQAASTKQAHVPADIYALGVILYEGLSGRRPFEAQHLAELAIKVHQGECRAIGELVPTVPSDVAAIVEKAMHQDPDARFSSAAALADALAPFALESDATVAPPELVSWRRFVPPIALVAVVAMATMAWVAWVPPAESENPAPDRGFGAARIAYIEADNLGCLEALGSDDATPSATLRAACLLGAGRAEEAEGLLRETPELSEAVLSDTTVEFRVLVRTIQDELDEPTEPTLEQDAASVSTHPAEPRDLGPPERASMMRREQPPRGEPGMLYVDPYAEDP
ncbi:MAG: serine/threonine-protein kinase [Myxococcota bacterium]